MRLIDVDFYCATICRCNRIECDKANCPIHNAPTAYDVNKVVEELEELTFNADVNIGDDGTTMNNDLIASKNAIKIVKQGGVSDNMIKSVDYNELFSGLEKDCNVKNCCNAFAYATLDELIELNYLLDRLLIFCENIDTEELEDYECGHEVFKLYKLADTLFSRDLS